MFLSIINFLKVEWYKQEFTQLVFALITVGVINRRLREIDTSFALITVCFQNNFALIIILNE